MKQKSLYSNIEVISNTFVVNKERT